MSVAINAPLCSVETEFLGGFITALTSWISPCHRQVAADEHADMHSILHHLLLRLQPDLEVLHKEEAALLPSGAAAVDALVELACNDIRYNPHRYYAWDRIAGTSRLSHHCSPISRASFGVLFAVYK